MTRMAYLKDIGLIVGCRNRQCRYGPQSNHSDCYDQRKGRNSEQYEQLENLQSDLPIVERH